MAIKSGHRATGPQGHKLKDKKILITAGPTWVPIDKVRVISNIATGETGILLAQKLGGLGAKVTLLLGPVNYCCMPRGIKVIRFNFFDELKEAITSELKNRKYDIIVHSAAVSDYRPQRAYPQKIKSGNKIWRLSLVPTKKIMEDIRRIAPKAKLVMFKFEPGVSKTTLIKRARAAQAKVNAEIVVANILHPYSAFIIARKQEIIAARSKKELVNKLTYYLQPTTYSLI